MGFQSGEEAPNAAEEAIVDDALVLQSDDLVLAELALLVDLILLCADEGSFVDIWVDFDVRVVAQLESILGERGQSAGLEGGGAGGVMARVLM